MKAGKIRNAEGFTLIECMITMFFMVFIIQGVAMISLYSQRSGVYARRLTSANILAEKALEMYRNIDYDNLPPFDGQQLCFDVHMGELGSCVHTDATFTQTTSVTADSPTANITLVDVTVSWVESLAWSDWHDTGPYEAKVVSYISKY